MHLKSLTICNFRKFEENNNTIEFVAATDNLARTNGNNPVAASTTLIVGRNNAGKTTVTQALELLVNGGSTILGKDFNFLYLSKILEEHLTGQTENLPFLEFKICVGVNKTQNDLLPNLAPFISIGDMPENEEKIDVEITIKYELKESSQFKADLKKLIKRYPENKKLRFRKFLEFLDRADFSVSYYGLSGVKVQNNRFKTSDLISLKSISASKNLNNNCLSKTFNKIIKYKYENDNTQNFKDLEDSIDKINQDITDEISTAHEESVNEVLREIVSDDNFSVSLSADLSFEKLINDLVKYEFSEGEQNIPEGQFGLGYSNLMNIIGEIIDYVARFPGEDCQSKINLISIEEPETHMHPQMQELFIKYIDDAVALLLESSGKKINSQLVITTHSSHILNSKIHSSNSFDNVNYICTLDGFSNVVKLNDHSVSNSEEHDEGKHGPKEDFKKKKLNELKFLKKHIKYKVSELFFSDAVIFVEGVTEETLLPFYIEQDADLKHYYISIFNINGAHGQVYYPLVKLLRVPTLVITDLDIKRTDQEKDDFVQITDLTGRKSTNSTISLFNQGSSALSNETSYYENNNMYGVFQKAPVETYHATSFEEAFILTNYKNSLTNEVLKNLKPSIYNAIVESGPNDDGQQIKENSFKLQKKLSGSKSDFSNELLFKIITADQNDERPVLPAYILDGLTWLKPKIENSIKGRS